MLDNFLLVKSAGRGEKWFNMCLECLILTHFSFSSKLVYLIITSHCVLGVPKSPKLANLPLMRPLTQLKKKPLFLPQLILTHHFPFKLNAKVMQVLISIFLYHDFSVRNFIKGVQVQSSFQIVFSYILLVVQNQLLLFLSHHSWPCWSTFTLSRSACCAVRSRMLCGTLRSLAAKTWRESGPCRHSRGAWQIIFTASVAMGLFYCFKPKTSPSKTNVVHIFFQVC